MIVLWFILPGYEVVLYPFSLIGIIPLIGGLWLSKHGSDTFEKAETNIHTFNNPDILVTKGIYKISRNPMYLGFLIALFGIAILLGDLVSFFLVFIFYKLVEVWYIKYEESIMEEMFKDSYKEYKQKVRRWI